MWQSDSSFRAFLSTATVSLKFENVVPGRRICSFTVAKFQFYCSIEHFSTISTYDETFFLALQHSSVFGPIYLCFYALLEPIAASATWIPKATTLEYLSFLHTRAPGES